ncbi:MAG: isopentenyl phosphate kinase family protein [Candidatus Micrarchaeota archaeon]|nr:isopentenyl phosphate kinase family protein [Candidatus Micrarchaeota archaeon]
MKRELILIKFGGSTITDVNKPNTPKLNNIRRLISEIKRAGRNKLIIVGHGGGSFPHVPAHKYKVHLGLIHSKSRYGTSLTQLSARQLNHIVMEEMLKAGVDAFSFSPSSSVVANAKKITRWDLKPIEVALTCGFTPVVYGDVSLDLKQGVSIVSSEEVFRYLALKLKPDRIIIGTDVDGVFDADPKQVKNAKLIGRIDRSNIDKVLFGPGTKRKYNVTGSMESKVRLLYSMSKDGAATCQIVNANVPGRIHDAIAGKKVVSTIITAK